MLVLAHGSDAHIADRRLELDQWMGAVVAIAGDSLAVGAEVGVVAYSALVADAFNVRLGILAFAKGTVAVDTIVADVVGARLRKWLVDGHEAVAGVDILRVLDTHGAEVEVRADQALVAYSIDGLIHVS